MSALQHGQSVIAAETQHKRILLLDNTKSKSNQVLSGLASNSSLSNMSDSCVQIWGQIGNSPCHAISLSSVPTCIVPAIMHSVWECFLTGLCMSQQIPEAGKGLSHDTTNSGELVRALMRPNRA